MTGYKGQTTQQKTDPDLPSDLYEPVKGNYGSQGRFTKESRSTSLEMFTDRRKAISFAAVGAALIGLHLLARKYDV